MTCATNLTANRNADFSATITFPPLYNFSGSTILMQVRESEGAPDPAIISVTGTANGSGTVITFTANRINILIKRADLEGAPDGDPVSEPWVGVYDIVITKSGVANYLFGGAFTILEGVSR